MLWRVSVPRHLDRSCCTSNSADAGPWHAGTELGWSRGLPTKDYAVEVDCTTAPGLAWPQGHAALVALEPGPPRGSVFEVAAGR